MRYPSSWAHAAALGWFRVVVLVVATIGATSHLSAPIAAAAQLSVSAMPLSLTLSGADLHILDEVVVWEDLWTGEYGAEITPRWFRPDPITSAVVQATLSLNSSIRLVGEGAYVRWDDRTSNWLVAPPSSTYMLYANSVFLWDGDYRFPTERQIGVPNVFDPSGSSPIAWTSTVAIGLTSGFLGAGSKLMGSGRFDLSAQVGLGLFDFYHRFDRLVLLTAEVFDDFDEDDAPDDYFYNEITLDHTASSDGTAMGPSVGLRMAGQFAGADITVALRQGWVRGVFATVSTFTDVDDIMIDYNWDGIWDEFTYLHGEVPFREDVTTTISTTTMTATLTFPLGPIRLGASAYHALYRGVPVSPDFSYRDLTVKQRIQDIAVSGLGAFVAIEF